MVTSAKVAPGLLVRDRLGCAVSPRVARGLVEHGADHIVAHDAEEARRARREGGWATDEEIGEAVGFAAMTRFWSTSFNGLQVDLAT